MNEHDLRHDPPAPPQAVRPLAMRDNMPVYDSIALFGTARTVIIRHAGEEYRLTLTRQNKLILTK
ncbi:MAG: hemin uptake protein HemP [Thiobacillaceae bacterium]|nr:hemin uptake protein HemP [Thiobacillaceae bacterium]